MSLNRGDRANRKTISTPTNGGASHSGSDAKEKSEQPASESSVPDAPVTSSDKENKKPAKKGKAASPTSIYKPSKTSTTAR